MRAMVFYRHGGPEVLEYRTDIPMPEPGPDDVLVRVNYAALNRLDDFVRTGWKGLELEMPHILGSDFSGTIAAMGSNVRGWSEGQRVVADPSLSCGHCPPCLGGHFHLCDNFAILGEHVRGGYAEYVKVPARNLLAIPDGFPDDQAAAAPLVGLTAWHMLIGEGGLRAGETVLVVGAGGGVNSMAIQIAKLAGATVYAVAGNAEKARTACELGAQAAVDRSTEPNWSKAIWGMSGKRGVDLVVDNVGEATWGSSLRALAKGGRMVVVGGTTGYNAVTPVNLIFSKHLRIIGSNMGTPDDFNAVMQQVWAGRIRAVVDEVFPLENYPQALERLRTGEGFGKIVLKIS